MNQSQNSKVVIRNVSVLLDRLEVQKNFKFFSYEDIYIAMTFPTVLHRFPKKMSQYLAESLVTVKNKFDGNPINVFVDRNNIVNNLMLFKGIGEHKANIAVYICDCVKSHQIALPSNLHCNISEEDIVEEVTYIESLNDDIRI
ncbi:MAG: hypothetical protein K2L07_01885 [Lachnospiraceae bacterium]|nr:hypothetical protein [Lachnospiraceae bacterium]